MILIKKITTNFEPTDNSDVLNKDHVDEKVLKINGHLSSLKKDQNEFKLQYNEQSVEEVLIERAVKTIIQIICGKSLFDYHAKTDEVLEGFLVTTRHRGDLSEEINDNVQ